MSWDVKGVIGSIFTSPSRQHEVLVEKLVEIGTDKTSRWSAVWAPIKSVSVNFTALTSVPEHLIINSLYSTRSIVDCSLKEAAGYFGSGIRDAARSMIQVAWVTSTVVWGVLFDVISYVPLLNRVLGLIGWDRQMMYEALRRAKTVEKPPVLAGPSVAELQGQIKKLEGALSEAQTEFKEADRSRETELKSKKELQIAHIELSAEREKVATLTQQLRVVHATLDYLLDYVKRNEMKAQIEVPSKNTLEEELKQEGNHPETLYKELAALQLIFSV